jgi:Glycosyl transferases group 1
VTGELAFVVPAGLSRPTGGNRYDQSVAAALAALGLRPDLREVPGAWPVGSPADRARLARQLTGPAPVLVDGLLACGAPAEISAAVLAGQHVIVLVHMPLGLDPALTAQVAAQRDALEGQALRAASAVVATSAWTAADLRTRHGLPEVAVAVPGSDPAALARGSTPPLLLHLAAVTPLKNQLTTVQALARLTDLPWTASLTGALDVDPGYVQAVRAAITRHSLDERVVLTGPQTGEDLDRLWDASNLVLLPSLAETWGMVVTEGLARGLPAVVGRGTGATQALGTSPDGDLPGAIVDPGSAVDLAEAIRDLLGSGSQRARSSAAARREGLPAWHDAARIIQRTIEHLPQPASRRAIT